MHGANIYIIREGGLFIAKVCVFSTTFFISKNQGRPLKFFMVEEKGSDINVAFLFFRFSAPNMQNNSAKSRQNQRI